MREHRGGLARVAPDDRLGAALGFLGQHARGGLPKLERKFGRDFAIREATHTVGTKQTSHVYSFTKHVCPTNYRTRPARAGEPGGPLS